MSLFAACSPPGGWLPFQDPGPDSLENLVETMRSRITMEETHARLQPTDYEKSDKVLRRLLKKHSHDLEAALSEWHRWAQWRREHDVEGLLLRDEDVQHELREHVFRWAGRNKQHMLCCVITARQFDAQGRQGTYSSYKKFLVRSVEEGLRRADASDDPSLSEQVCVIYDRRGLGYAHVDPGLHQSCRKLVEELRDFYGQRLGALYVLHCDWSFRLLYNAFIWPLLALLAKDQHFVVLQEPHELLAHFDSDQLLLLAYQQPEEDAGGAAEEQPSAP
eukprot:gene33008-39926_t